MENWIPTTISILALLFSVAAFVWQHLRVKDAAVCTLVGSDCDFNGKKAVFQFAVANLGTRSLLVKGMCVSIYFDPGPSRFFMDRSICRSALPHILKASEMTTVIVESPWDEPFLTKAEEFAKKSGNKSINLFFEATLVLWNPKGKRLCGSCYVGSYERNDQGQYQKMDVPDACVFRLPVTRKRSNKKR